MGDRHTVNENDEKKKKFSSDQYCISAEFVMLFSCYSILPGHQIKEVR